MPGHKSFSAKVAAPAKRTANKPGVAQSQVESVEEAVEAANALGNEVQFAKVKDNPAALKSPLTPQNILRLQNTLGNQAVQRLIAGKPQTGTAKPVSADAIQRFPLAGLKTLTHVGRKSVGRKDAASNEIMFFISGEKGGHISIIPNSDSEFTRFHVSIPIPDPAGGAERLNLHYFFDETPAGWVYLSDTSENFANGQYTFQSEIPDFEANKKSAQWLGDAFGSALSRLTANARKAAAAAGKAADNGPSAAAAAAAATHSAGAAAAGGGAGGYYNPPSAAAAKYVPIQPSPAPMGTYSPASGSAASNSSNSASATASPSAAPALEPATPVVDVSPTAAAAAAAVASATTDSISAEAPAPAPAEPAAVLPVVDKVLDGQAANPNQLITPQAANSAMAAASLPANAVAELDRQLAQARSQQVSADSRSAAAPASPNAAPITLRKFLILLAVVALVLAIVSKKDIENWLEKFLTPVNDK